MLKQLLLAVVLCAPWCAQGQEIAFGAEERSASTAAVTADQINAIGHGRYTAATPFGLSDWSVFGDQPAFRNEGQFEGYGLSTAGALGLSDVWNELPGNRSTRVILNPSEPVRHLGTMYYLENCRVGGKPYKNRIKPVIPPAPPPAVVPPPTVAASEPPPALPLCKLTGTYDISFLGVALNGEGKFTFDGQSIAHEKADEIDVLEIEEASVGTHTVEYTVSGPGGSVTCESKFDIFDSLRVADVSGSITIPPIRFCDTDRDGWRPDHMFMGMVEKIRCDPGAIILDTALGALGGFGLSRISHGGAGPPAAMGSKPAHTVNPGALARQTPTR